MTLSLAELASAAGMSKPQLRKWIEFGVVSRSHGRGKGRYFTYEHLEEIWAAKHRRSQNVTLIQMGAERHG